MFFVSRLNWYPRAAFWRSQRTLVQLWKKKNCLTVLWQQFSPDFFDFWHVFSADDARIKCQFFDFQVEALEKQALAKWEDKSKPKDAKTKDTKPKEEARKPSKEQKKKEAQKAGNKMF